MSRPNERAVRKGDLASEEVKDDLVAAYAARRELPSTEERAIIASFLERLDATLDARIEARVQELMRHQKLQTRGNATRMAATLALAIPLVAIAGGIAGVNGVIAVCVLVVVLNLLPR